MIYILLAYFVYFLIGCLLAIVSESFCNAERIHYKGINVFIGKFWFTNWTFPFILFAEDVETAKHEFGHEIQMIILFAIEMVIQLVGFDVWYGWVINTCLFFPVFAGINYFIATWLRIIFKLQIEDYWFETLADWLGKKV